MLPRIRTPKETYTIDYQKAIELAEQQLEVFWTAEEIAVEKDIQDILVNMTEPEAFAVIYLLKLFTIYELYAGNEYWGTRVAKEFPRPDIQRMANAFSFFELNVHAPFYNKLNEALNINTDEFYSEYKEDPVLSDRINHVWKIINGNDLPLSLALFSMVEGVVLYSSFAFFKHFQTGSKNKLLNVVRGIDFSVRDENLHSLGGAWLFQQLVKESNFSQERLSNLEGKIIHHAKKLCEHEKAIIAKVFEKGKIEGITEKQMVNFIESRIDLCLQNLGYEPIYKVTYNPIKDWFYDSINSVQFHDFFTGIGNEYNRKWDESKFIAYDPKDLKNPFNQLEV